MSWTTQAERDAGITCGGCILLLISAAIVVGGLIGLGVWIAR